MGVRKSEAWLRDVLSRPGYEIVENGRVLDLPSNARSPLRTYKEPQKGPISCAAPAHGNASWQVALLPTLQNRVFSEKGDFEPSDGMRYRMGLFPDRLFLPIHAMGYLRHRSGDAYLLRKPEASLSESQRKYARAMRRYSAYRDELRALWAVADLALPEAGLQLAFFLPMFKSWSDKRRREHLGMPHRRKPDTDNLVKAFIDALVREDSMVWHLGEPAKYWADGAWIEVGVAPGPALPAIVLAG